MKFKVDENLPVEISEILQNHGYDSITVLDQNLGGKTDQVLIKICKQEERILITLDLDFSDIRVYPPAEFPGFIILRPHYQDKNHIIKLFRKAVELINNEKLEGCLWIVEETKIRIYDDK